MELVMKKVYETDVLSSKAKSGKDKFWKAKIVEEKGKYYLQKEFWQGEDGKHQTSDPYLIEGKNIGRANETSDKEQAKLELERAFKKQLDSGYTKEGETYDGPILPMLAYQWQKRKNNIKYPCAIQAKWDGVRCLSFENVFWSRKGKLFIPQITEHLHFDSKQYILDGELVIEGAIFEDLVSYTKKIQKDQTRLEYHVFDIVDKKLPFNERFEILRELLKKAPKQVKLSSTYIAKNEDEVAQYHAKFTEFFNPSKPERNKMGYFEGTIIRNLNGLYSIGHRSADLLKLKDFVDEEFEIIDFYEGKGRNAGTITFICKAGEETFHVNPMGTMEYRAKMWKERESLRGKMLTVEFQEKTERGVPRFPVGKAIRDYE